VRSSTAKKSISETVKSGKSHLDFKHLSP
jgi:hypothetical protein